MNFERVNIFAVPVITGRLLAALLLCSALNLLNPERSFASKESTSDTEESTADKSEVPTEEVPGKDTPTPTTAPTATPTPTPTLTNIRTPTPIPTETATPTAQPTVTPSTDPTAEPSADPSAEPSANATATPTVEATPISTATPNASMAFITRALSQEDWDRCVKQTNGNTAPSSPGPWLRILGAGACSLVKDDPDNSNGVGWTATQIKTIADLQGQDVTFAEAKPVEDDNVEPTDVGAETKLRKINVTGNPEQMGNPVSDEEAKAEDSASDEYADELAKTAYSSCIEDGYSADACSLYSDCVDSSVSSVVKDPETGEIVDIFSGEEAMSSCADKNL